MTDVVAKFLERVDAFLLPYGVTENDPAFADKIRIQKSNVQSVWQLLLINSTSPSSSAPSTASSSQAPDSTAAPQPPPAPQQPLPGDQRAAVGEARKLEQELERSRLRAVVAEIQGPGNHGGNYSPEFVTARASDLFVGHAALFAAFSALVRVTYGFSAFDNDGVTPTTPAKILSKIPQDGAASAK